MSTRNIPGGKGGRWVRLTTYRHTVLSRNLGALTSQHLLGLFWPVTGQLCNFSLTKLCYLNSLTKHISYMFRLLEAIFRLELQELSTVGFSFCDGPFYEDTRIHFYDPCQVGPSTPDFWCVTVATQASFLYSARFWLFSDVHVFLLFFYFSAFLLSWLWFFHPWRP